MRQILYVSNSVAPRGQAELDVIVERSRHNNAIEGVTGLLWSDGSRFIQVIEGSEESVSATFDRIMDDPRHEGITVLHDRTIDTREFGSWAMMQRNRWDTADEFDARMRRHLSRAAPEIRDTFLYLVAIKTEA